MHIYKPNISTLIKHTLLFPLPKLNLLSFLPTSSPPFSNQMGCFSGCFGPQKWHQSDHWAKADDRVCPEGGLVNEPLVSKVKKYSWEEIEKLTMRFSKVIGVGGFSMVYLAKFPNTSFGAIKVYNCSERLNQVFKCELEISQMLHHPNIVKFLGYCDDKDEGVLVFEYISSGNLQEKLHTQNSTKNTTKIQTLTWKQRITIAYKLAQSLEYLHNLQIVHGDIKASNILLDDHLEPLLCDFGLAKMGFSSMIKPNSSSHLTLMGSPGYIDPHFLATGLASKKSDVYSFGVILLELITGLEAFLGSGDGEVRLTSLVRTKERFDVEKVVKMADPRVRFVDEEEVKALANIARVCLEQFPSMRPCASEICNLLREKFSSISLFVSSEKL